MCSLSAASALVKTGVNARLNRILTTRRERAADLGDADGTETAGRGCAHGANPNVHPARRGSVLMICCIGTYIPSCTQGPGRPVT